MLQNPATSSPVSTQHQGGDEARDDEGEGGGRERESGTLGEVHPASPAPVMAEPSSCGVIVCGSN